MKQVKRKPKEKKVNLFVVDTENEIVPKNQNLVREKRAKHPRLTPEQSMNGITAKVTDFESVDPFKNCNSFIKYYTSVIRTKNRDAKFNTYDVERIHAMGVLDMMILNNRDSIRFLKGWIIYFAETRLKGDTATNREKTSIRTFKETFGEYNSKYIHVV